MHGGATSLGDAGENRLGWILGGLVVLAIAVIVIVFLRAQRQTTAPVTQASPANNLAAPTPGQPGLVNGGDQAPDFDQAPPTVDLETARSPADAVRELQAAMQLRRVWASTGIDTKDSSIVTIQSGQCEDEAMREALDAVRPVLKKAAFVAVRCIAQHGTDVFQERL